MGNASLDAHILSCCETRWLKVARIVGQASERADVADKPWGYEAVAKRIRVLVRKRQLEAAGNLWNWRASEVRLPTDRF